MAVIINGDTGIDKITDGSIVAADIGAGEITDAKLASGIDAAKLTGTLPAIDGSALTGISSYSDSDALTLFNASGSAPVYACRAWVNFNGTGTVAIRSSGNVSSITDNGTGDYTVNFTNAMSDVNYSTNITADTSAANNSPAFSNTFFNQSSASSIRMIITNNATAYFDSPRVSVAVFR